MGKRRKEENIYDYTGAVDVEAMREDRVEQPTEFTAPEKDQKWRARELFGFMWRHLGIGIAPGFRDIMLFLIEKANANTGRVDWRQNKIAKVMKLSRDYISEGIQWWATQTPYLKAQRRQNKDGWFISNAYHIQWRAIDLAWEAIHAESVSATDAESMSASDAENESATRNTKSKCKVEVHPERVHASRGTNKGGLQGKGELEKPLAAHPTENQPSERSQMTIRPMFPDAPKDAEALFISRATGTAYPWLLENETLLEEALACPDPADGSRMLLAAYEAHLRKGVAA